MINWNLICKSISDATQAKFVLNNASSVSGGCTNSAWHLEGCSTSSPPNEVLHYFVKLNSADKAYMFAAESAGLEALANSHSIRVPRIICEGVADQYAYLVLEYMDLHSRGNSILLGEQIAALHKIHNDKFGWLQDNTLALTHQNNTWTGDWLCFWRDQRLGFQLEQAYRNGFKGEIQVLGHQVMDAMPDLFKKYTPEASLLHGDLWGGNHAYLNDGTPVIFDPAPYYGDRETDIAMTELFGGFDHKFYASYQASYPLEAGYDKRKYLYNLYHILNHCNLFGSSYTPQAIGLMKKILSGR